MPRSTFSVSTSSACEPGFGVDTALDDTLLAWVSRVVKHEVNLYWGSTLYASSNPELFTAGLLPPRIPARSTPSSPSSPRSPRRASTGPAASATSSSTRRCGFPASSSQELLFLSIPLLAQQEEVQTEIDLATTRAVLVALVLWSASSPPRGDSRAASPSP